MVSVGVSSVGIPAAPHSFRFAAFSFFLVSLVRPLFNRIYGVAPAACLPFHLIGHRLPAHRHGWAGREAGSVGALLAWFCPAVCVDADNRFTPYLPAMSPRSACLSSRLRGRWRPRPVCAVPSCVSCLLAARLAPRLVHRPAGRVGSVFLSPRLATRWAGRRADALRLRRANVPRFDFDACLAPCACLPRGVPRSPHRPLMWMAAAVCGLSARREGCLLAPLYPCRAVPFVSDPGRFIPWLVRLMRLCAVALML